MSFLSSQTDLISVSSSGCSVRRHRRFKRRTLYTVSLIISEHCVSNLMAGVGTKAR